MVRNNHVISKNHFKKKNWNDRLKLQLNTVFRKRRRNLKRQRKATSMAPRPAGGPIRPLVQCSSIRYNTKTRYGRGFSLAEIARAGLNQNFARSIGVAVDHRRRNKSYEVLQRNVQRLKEYLAKLVLFPKNSKKIVEFESSAENYRNCGQLMGKVMPKMKPKKLARAASVASVPKVDVYLALRMAKIASRRKPLKKNAKKCVTFEKLAYHYQ